jgi:DNA polymerase III epsilon subunit-like protein
MLRSRITKQQVIDYARKKIESKPIYLDTETTGLEDSDEIIEIAIVNVDGIAVFDSFIKPSKTIPEESTRIHNITNDMVKTSPTWPEVWPQIKEILLGHPIGMYNAPFDIRMIEQTLRIYGIPLKEKLKAFDVLKVYSDFRGVWDHRRRAMRRFRLEAAGQELGIPMPNSHRALDDTLLTRAVFHAIAGLPYE